MDDVSYENDGGHDSYDVSVRSTDEPGFHEWLLSDHPLASAERQRREADYLARQLPGLEKLLVAAAKVESDPHAGEQWRSLATQLREGMDDIVGRDALQSGFGDPAQVVQARKDYEHYRRSQGEADYEYPAHYVGEQAASHPPPPTN